MFIIPASFSGSNTLMPFKTGDLEIDNQFAGSLAKNLERFQVHLEVFALLNNH